jgi:ubiquinone/menaquinone biosynthesis C-methylase UbiE
MPGVKLMGIEPEAALRKVAYEHGVGTDELIDGDGTKLPFANGSFDIVTSFGVLHHVRNPKAVVEEMLRVARRAVLISDLNCYAFGPLPKRLVSQTLHGFGLWKAFQWIKTGGRMSKFSEGDGTHYSFSVHDVLPLVRARTQRVHLINSRGSGTNLYRTSPFLTLLAFKEDSDIVQG